MGRAQATAAFSRGLRPAHSPSCPRAKRAPTLRHRAFTRRKIALSVSLRGLRCSVLKSVISIVSLSLSLSLCLSHGLKASTESDL
jgi:hypothetical protein